LYLGTSVSISADGNTVIVGGGATGPNPRAWIFTRTNGAWSGQGPALTASGAVSQPVGSFAAQVAISGDGNTAAIDAVQDDGAKGAAWIFTRNHDVWTEQGPKLVGTGAINAAQGAGQGAVALSFDGNTLLLGGGWDNQSIGATWFFQRENGNWAQQGTSWLARVRGDRCYKAWRSRFQRTGTPQL
jgi:hypothetical protein